MVLHIFVTPVSLSLTLSLSLSVFLFELGNLLAWPGPARRCSLPDKMPGASSACGNSASIQWKLTRDKLLIVPWIVPGLGLQRGLGLPIGRAHWKPLYALRSQLGALGGDLLTLYSYHWLCFSRFWSWEIIGLCMDYLCFALNLALCKWLRKHWEKSFYNYVFAMLLINSWGFTRIADKWEQCVKHELKYHIWFSCRLLQSKTEQNTV